MKTFVWSSFVVLIGFTTVLLAEKSERSSELTAEIVIATHVEDRVPQGESKKFSAKVEELIGWTRIKGAKEPTKVNHIWIHEGEEKSNIELEVRSSSFRTWSRKSIGKKDKGQWVFEVRDYNQALIGSKKFSVK